MEDKWEVGGPAGLHAHDGIQGPDKEKTDGRQMGDKWERNERQRRETTVPERRRAIKNLLA